MAELPALGLVAEIKGKRRLLRTETLLKQWTEAYARTLRPKLVMGYYHTNQTQWWQKATIKQYGLAFGAEVAAEQLTSVLQPETVTIYGQKVDPQFLLNFKLQENPDGKIEVLKRFWAFQTQNDELTPKVLTYADLLTIGDARCLEAADNIYEDIVDGFKR